MIFFSCVYVVSTFMQKALPEEASSSTFPSWPSQWREGASKVPEKYGGKVSHSENPDPERRQGRATGQGHWSNVAVKALRCSCGGHAPPPPPHVVRYKLEAAVEGEREIRKRRESYDCHTSACSFQHSALRAEAGGSLEISLVYTVNPQARII